MSYDIGQNVYVSSCQFSIAAEISMFEENPYENYFRIKNATEISFVRKIMSDEIFCIISHMAVVMT